MFGCPWMAAKINRHRYGTKLRHCHAGRGDVHAITDCHGVGQSTSALSAAADRVDERPGPGWEGPGRTGGGRVGPPGRARSPSALTRDRNNIDASDDNDDDRRGGAVMRRAYQTSAPDARSPARHLSRSSPLPRKLPSWTSVGLSSRVVSASDCGVRGPRFESHRGRLCLSRDSCCTFTLQCLGRLSLPPSLGR